MLMYVYELRVSGNGFSFYGTNWKREFENIAILNQ